MKELAQFSWVQGDPHLISTFVDSNTYDSRIMPKCVWKRLSFIYLCAIGCFNTVLRIKGCCLWNPLWRYQHEFRHAYFQKFTDDFLNWKISRYVTLYSQSVWKFGFCWFFSFGSKLRAETTEEASFPATAATTNWRL